MSKLGPCAPGFCVAMEALDWQPVCCSLQTKAQDKVSQIAKQLRGVMCGNCRPMGTPTEDVCCHKNPCITRHEEFYLLCVNYLVLTVAILGRVDIRADPIDYSPSSYRKAAYRQYIYWIHGYLGRGNRRVIPSCVVLAIRRWFPSPTGVYMGFREY